MNETTLTKNGTTLTLERTINAPKDKVWQAYSDPELFVQWWGPEGWSTRVKQFDFQAGGSVLYGMKCEDEAQAEWYGQESWGKFEFGAVSPTDSFSYTDYFCDEDGTATDGMPATKTVLRLEELDGKTKIVSVSEYDSEAALQQVLDMGMEEGIKQTFNRLETLLQAA